MDKFLVILRPEGYKLFLLNFIRNHVTPGVSLRQAKQTLDKVFEQPAPMILLDGSQLNTLISIGLEQNHSLIKTVMLHE